jgi:adenylate cyclase
MLKVVQDGETLILVSTDPQRPKIHRCPGLKMIIGSDPACDLRLPDLSARHAELERGEAGAVLTDLGSETGTFVNGKRIVRVRLKDGDVLGFGGPQESSAEGPETTQTFRVAPIGGPSGERMTTSGARGLLELSVAFGRPSSLADKLDQILEYSLRLGQFDRAAVWVVNPDKDDEILYQRQRQLEGQPPAKVSQTILRQVLKGDAVIVSDASADTLVRHAMSVKLQNVRTCVALPLRTTERIWGMLYLDCLHPQPLAGPEEQEFLAGFASLAAVAIENGWFAAKSQKEALLKERLSRFFPPTTVDRILQRPDGRLEGAVLPVTILFCDIRNYTGISFAQPPERVAAWLDDYFARIVPLVFANGGTLEKYIGDAMLAIWGAPTPLSPAEQALHACRAAARIQQAVAEFAGAWPDLPCQVGIGIHHGPAYVGTIGHESYLQYAALGSTTNLAARLCSAAGPGETILSRYLADLLPANEFTSLPRPAVHAKGFPEVVEVSLLTPAP